MFYLIENNIGGLFSDFMTVLGALYQFKMKFIIGMVVLISKRSRYYNASHGDNVWEYYFDPINISHTGNFTPTLRIYTDDIKGSINAIVDRMDRIQGHNLITQYIKIRPEILSEIVLFERNNFKGFMIGIHYRGTDKSNEAARVKYEDVFDYIDTFLKTAKLSNWRIFVASDEDMFIKRISARYLKRVVYLNIYRSPHIQLPLHYSKQINPFLSGKYALIDCVLLSRTDILFRTSSNLGYMSSFFNPSIPIIDI